MNLEEKRDQDRNHPEEEYEKVCYVCRRPESKAGKMITLPGGIDVCRDCMQRAMDTVGRSGIDWSRYCRIFNVSPTPEGSVTVTLKANKVGSVQQAHLNALVITPLRPEK